MYNSLFLCFDTYNQKWEYNVYSAMCFANYIAATVMIPGGSFAETPVLVWPHTRNHS